MTGSGAVRQLLLFGPLLLVGFGAGVLRALGQRPGLPQRQRRLYGALWVLTLLLGAPLWLFLAVTMGL